MEGREMSPGKGRSSSATSIAGGVRIRTLSSAFLWERVIGARNEVDCLIGVRDSGQGNGEGVTNANRAFRERHCNVVVQDFDGIITGTEGELGDRRVVLWRRGLGMQHHRQRRRRRLLPLGRQG
ncbi:unnamed protein product [Ectocarpus sp. CCAP 1310/34]|nr:unnamed protein product [Ectocarpus sp. CCAP 1310/34]